jgi:hypothetical protein
MSTVLLFCLSVNALNVPRLLHKAGLSIYITHRDADSEHVNFILKNLISIGQKSLMKPDQCMKTIIWVSLRQWQYLSENFLDKQDEHELHLGRVEFHYHWTTIMMSILNSSDNGVLYMGFVTSWTLSIILTF